MPGAGHVITTQRSPHAQSPDDHDQGRTTISLSSVSPGHFSHSAFQYLLLLGIVSAAPTEPYKEEELPPQPYEYKYGVADDYGKSAFDKAETQDEYGNVQGSYKV